MKQWYAVHSKPRQEATAELNLQRQGFETYLPQIKVRKQKRSEWATVIEPLFPRYLFIRVNPSVDNTAPVRSTRGVVGLVRIGSELRPVPDEVIDYFKQAEDPTDELRAAEQWPHRPGDHVEVLHGALAGLNGIYQMQVGESRALLLVELLGRFNEVQVDMHEIVASD